MNRKRLISLAVFTLLFTAAVASLRAQDGSRSITSVDFASQRPENAKSVKKGSKASRARKQKKGTVYHRVRKPIERPARPTAAVKKKLPADAPLKVTEIGVTVWRMRPPKPREAGFLLPVKTDGEDQMWLAERVALDTIFKAGDKVRFAVESSVSGYLYIFNRESRTDGSFGDPTLVFPEDLAEDNSVKPGVLVDVPDRREHYAYLKMDPKKDNYSGELMTIVISPTRLTNLRRDREGKLADGFDLTDLEGGSEVETFSQKTSKAEQFFTKAESEASCGVKTRELRREKTEGNPCGATARQLTRDEPRPQSIHRVKGAAGQPAVAFVKLAVR